MKSLLEIPEKVKDKTEKLRYNLNLSSWHQTPINFEDPMLIPQAEIELAEKTIRQYIPVTPVVKSEYYSDLLKANIYFKLEMLHPTHSFKVRGAYNAIVSLSQQERQNGVVTASGGNHGLGVSLVAKTLGIPASIFLPETTPRIKIDAIKRLGAEVTLVGKSWDDANEEALKKVKSHSMAYIHPFDNQKVMAGQGTLVKELITQVDNIDKIVVSMGGGGLISGIISGVQYYSPKTEVIGVETKGADCIYQSVKAGKIVVLDEIASVAESLAPRRTAPQHLAIISQYVQQLIVVEDEDAIKELLRLLKEEKLLVEPAASCSLAALTLNNVDIQPNDNIVVVMCGSNVPLDRIFEWYHQYQ